ncbi:arylsulfatase [Roseomonas nepalensis]|uniref:Arylsulfatase n=1 Tax=Muricoccus nepalensis TaxID=1854500 RepID=A0A502G7X0_9PROT|nr:aspartate/glutamate racemase family protein [Roseomonas nepalensis]TPG57146.1 arylsulfatase [Roseomonas nepalensis]
MTPPAPRKRVMLVHALRESLAPIHAAFAAAWPEAETHDLLDSSLSADHAASAGRLDRKMTERFRALGRYAAATGPEGRGSDAILFTCSAFGPAIEAVRRDQAVPVLKPNEAAFAEALRHGPRIGLLCTFAPTRAPAVAELEAMAAARGITPVIEARVVEGALAALQAGRGEEHDALSAAAAAGLPPVDAVVIAQFSMARAAPAVRVRLGVPVLTTPDSAVAALRAILG